MPFAQQSRKTRLTEKENEITSNQLVMFYAVISRFSHNKKRRLSGRWPTRPLSPSTETVSPIPSQKYFQSYRPDHRSRAVAPQSDQYLSLVRLPLNLARTKQQQSQHFVQQLRPSQGERYRGG